MSILTESETKGNFREILVPISLSNLGGPFALGVASIESNTTDRGVAVIRRLQEPIEWVSDFNHVYFQSLRDGITLKAIRLATQEDFKKYRTPIWIQSDESPICCGKRMFFIGQIDDTHLFAERPLNAKMWWHDWACFYVFTCPQCLSVQAVGQQL